MNNKRIYEKNLSMYKDIVLGMLLVKDLDGFMLGNRWLVAEKMDDGSFYAQHYYCGNRDPYLCNDWIIKEKDDRMYLYQIGETLENWKEKFKKQI